MFVKYPSIENHYRDKHINYWLEAHPELEDAKFILQEKIHGSNIQIEIFKDGSVVLYSRNREIPLEENFFGCWDVIQSELWQNIIKDISFAMTSGPIKHQSIRLYGEIFGSGVNKGVDYGKEKQIRLFDMMIDDALLSPREMEGVFDGLFGKKFRESVFVPTVCCTKGIRNALSLNIEVPSYLTPSDVMHKMIKSGQGVGIIDKKNIMEGVVIKPYKLDPVFDVNGSPFYIKMKNEAFKEQSKKAKTPRKDIDPILDSLQQTFESYLTEQRVLSVFSKEGEISDPKDIGKYIKLIIADATEDFLKDNTLNLLPVKSHRNVFSTGGRIISKQLMKYL